jgi:hypothetical protein
MFLALARSLEAQESPACAGRVTVKNITPTLIYPRNDQCRLAISGQGFDSELTNDQVLINDQIVNTKPLKENDVEPGDDVEQPYLHYIDGNTLALGGLPTKKYTGSYILAVKVGNCTSRAVRFVIPAASRLDPLVCAGAVVTIIVLFVVFLAWKGSGKQIANVPYSLLSDFLLDSQTDTYSLSKLQIYLWVIAFGFSWTYLLLIRVCIQGGNGMPDVPPSAAGAIFLSAGTLLMAAGVNSAHGPKGAGAVQPGLYDLISSGGVVAADRFQFLVWTLLGVFAYVLTTLSVSKQTISQLPEIPAGLLYLMGIGSFGYVGGKMLRTSGPIIDSIVAQCAKLGSADAITIDISGTGLEQDAAIKIGDQNISYELVDANGTRSASSSSTPIPEKDGLLQVVQKDATSTNPKAGALLRLTLTKASTVVSLKANLQEQGAAKPVNLTIVNSDGQQAVWPLPKTLS